MNTEKINLHGDWNLFQAPLNAPQEYINDLLKNTPEPITSPVPGDIHQGLINAGLLKEPTKGLNAKEASWTREKSWWLRKSFNISPLQLKTSQNIRLCLDGLDSNAWIYINDKLLGKHNSAFRPFSKDIMSMLETGTNTITVRLTEGVEGLEKIGPTTLGGEIPVDPRTPERFELRRVFIRKPQYSWGWDWAPESSTTGITGNAYIQIACNDHIEDLQIKTNGNCKDTRLDICVTTQRYNQLTCKTTNMQINIFSPENTLIEQKTQSVTLQTGKSFHNFCIPIEDPQLWWPNGSGSQPRYRITAAIIEKEQIVSSIEKKIGIRFAELDTQDNFAIKINNVPIFCKGANLIPADLYYGRASTEKYSELIKLAKEANFNMLRIWGGGLYLSDEFYDECDKAGIMIWHDFMFACAPYPDYDEAFCDEIQKEVNYQLKRLNHHPSIVLWCGDNENILNRNSLEKTQNGARVTGQILPEAVNNLCSQTIYWFSSPYGTGDNYKHISCDTPGNCHIWKNVMLSPNMEDRINFNVFDNMNPCFVSEYGFPGTCTKQTTIEYTENPDFTLESPQWMYHYNPFARNVLESAIQKHYAEDLAGMSTEEFLYYGGIIQGKAYQHSLESFRQNPKCNGALFWMFNDCWGEVGWTIIDYYMRYKASYWFVKRAFNCMRLVIRQIEDNTIVTLINDTDKNIEKEISLYYYNLQTNSKQLILSERLSVEPYNSKKMISKPQSVNVDPKIGLWLCQADDNKIDPATLLLTELKNTARKPAKIAISNIDSENNRISFELKSDNYAHGVELDLPQKAIPSDNYFDLIPGIKKKVTVKNINTITEANIKRYI
ncbi:MAG: glycosyl hydrolase 2 galactose-binding domain-containing protein [Sedimentisphaeraceae bacterium JB056]